MNTVRIILKEFKLNFRNFKSNIMMVLFPIVLIIILGAAFTNSFDSTVKLDNVKLLYTEDIKENGQTLAGAFKSFREGLTKETGITFEETDDVDMGIASIKDYRYSAYLYISDDLQEMKLYKNEKHAFEASLIESTLNSFINTYGAMSAIEANNPAAMAMLQLKEHGNYVSVRPLNEKRQPGSLDYYAITMMTMILLYASMTGFYGIKSDMEQMTANRTLCAPVKRYELLTGKVLGSILVTLVQGLAVILFSGLILKANWGDDPATVTLLLLSYSIMAVSMGVGLAYLFRNSDAASGILNSIIPIFVFLGGGYVPLEVMGSTASKFSVISPVNWINSALLRVIYDGDYSHVPISLGINLAIAAAFILIAVLFSRKGTGKYA